VDLDIVFLGTSASVPTAQRAPTALVVRRGGDRLLFDCGEGTQRQLLRSSVGLVELREVFVSHFHADHYLGLPGMLKTFALRGRELPLIVYGPPGLSNLFASLRRVFGKLTYPLELVELQPGDVLEREEYNLVTFPVAHGVQALGYALVEHPRPGRFDVETADALGVPPGPERGAEVLVHEATFLDEERDRARETAHSTALEAAELAREAEVALLALTHLSNRYFGPEVAREARTIFPETVVPKDFDVIDVPFPERGSPRLIKGGVSRSREEQVPETEVVP
jgi:ribonuclease Z